ncbi:putative LRR receptor-like serine/threonine-protein kinase [Platanthera guangdongensis]|uniref:LRR receptor-like serine/threonine-protein kinase n=1 Tax=Platanthera guangdongensis TaxID=2320717 RepID=A0ABR2M568_9ASPA
MIDGDGICRKRTQLSLPPVCLLSILFLNSLSSISITTTLFIYAAATASSLSPPPPAADKEVLLNLKSFLLQNNPIHRGVYSGWNASDPSPCHWPGISCNSHGRADGIDLHDSSISGGIFPNFSLLPALARLDLSSNTLSGPIPPDLSQCRRLRYLNLSHNLIGGDLFLAGFSFLETLDVAFNRLKGRVLTVFPPECGNFVCVNISSNSFTGDIGDHFHGCRERLRYLDLSLNGFTGELPKSFWWLRELSASDNDIRGIISPETFPAKCNLIALDLSGNGLTGNFPDSIANCTELTSLNIWGNFFTGRIPSGIGSLGELNSLLLGNNSFEMDLPAELLRCKKLTFLDLSRNNLGPKIQNFFGNFTSVKFLTLHSNSYSEGIEESGVLNLPNLLRLDLSFNNFSRQLPAAASVMPAIKLLILSHNDFYGRIPPEYGRISTLQLLDLSFNRLSGRIPPQVGYLTSLLWLMLANNELVGEIPPEIGNCSSLLWLNLANNRLTGGIPVEIYRAGLNPLPTFQKNRRIGDLAAGSGECLTLKRWLPASNPPFNFIYTIMTRRRCSQTWDHLLRGFGIFPVCLNSSKPIQTLASSGYLMLSGNSLSGELPPEIGSMHQISLLHIDDNQFSGRFEPEIGSLPLIDLTASNNRFSGQIPAALGRIQCLQSLDISVNNFSGEFPYSLNGLSYLNKFNVSFNPFLHGIIPASGQIATFDSSSFIGDPLISFSISSLQNSSPPMSAAPPRRRSTDTTTIWIIIALIVPLFLFGIICWIFLCLKARSRSATHHFLNSYQDSAFPREESLAIDQLISSPAASSNPPSSAVFSGQHLLLGMNKMAAFTYPDIVAATLNFSVDKLIGCGGYGEVYAGVLPDGRPVAIKKLQRGAEGERAFRAEMETLGGGHPNLVALHGWCLVGSKKLLVYEYMQGGSLEDVIKDRHGFTWEQRLAAAVAVARALVYLHHECTPAVVHRDVKASNVMMDASGAVKLTDLGLARVVAEGRSHVSTVVAGTIVQLGKSWIMPHLNGLRMTRSSDETKPRIGSGWNRQREGRSGTGGGGRAWIRSD